MATPPLYPIHTSLAPSSLGHWEPLPSIIYGFAIHPLVPSVRSRRARSKSKGANGKNAEGDEVDGGDGEDQLVNQFQATLQVGDEVYAFEKFVPGDAKVVHEVWYRGYVVVNSRLPTIALTASTEPSPFTGHPAPAPAAVGAAEDPQVSIGVFPSSHIHVRDELADAEGRLADVYSRLHAQQDISSPSSASPRDRFPRGMTTLREEDESPVESDRRSSFGAERAKSPKGPRPKRSDSVTSPIQMNTGHGIEQSDPLAVKPAPPRPTLKSGDETASGATEPLIDEIASALREWHSLMFAYLSRRDYTFFTSVNDFIESLHLGRRQLLTQTLSAEETVNLRRECVSKLVRGNVAQGLDVIVRHPTWGGLVTVDVEGEVDPRSWASAIRMYAMQASLAYIDVSPTDIGGTVPRSSALGNLNDLASASPFSNPTTANLLSSLSRPNEKRRSLPLSPTAGLSPSPPKSTSAKFYHVYLELRAFVANPCAPGETTELYFSLYNKNDTRFLTEEFCAILNHNGVLARDTGEKARIGRVRTLFLDLGHHDIQESIFLVCRIVRNGAMKLSATPGSTSLGRNGTIRRGSDANKLTNGVRDTDSILNGGGNGSTSGHHTPAVSFRPDTAGDPPSAMFRRPFGCGVLELSQLARMSVDKTDASAAKEHILPIFVPVNEATYSTLHRDLIDTKVKEFEKSPRADSLAVMIKVFHGEAPTIIKENPSLLQDTPLTARLGFPDVVFPGDVRNEVFIKLWSGEFFFSSGGSIRIRKSVASFAGTTVGPCNIQVSVEVRTRVGQVIENAISQGAGEPPVTQFHSMIFYRNNTPTFGELIKLQLPIDLMQQCHLFFTFRHRSSKERALPVGSRMSGMPDSMGSTSDRPFAYGYLPLFPDGQEFVQDGSHTLVLYRADKSPRQSPEEYYGAPATIAAGLKPELLGIPPHLSRSAIPIRDSLVIRSYLCSTKYTQNPVLLGLLNWEKLSDKSELSTVLSKFTFVGEVEIVKFLSDIFDSLFAILVSGVNQHSELDDLVFNALVTVLGIVQDRRFNNFQPVLDVYIEQHFSCASAASHIIHSMNRLLSNPTGADTASPLRSAFKVWHYIFKFIIRARELQKTKEVGMGATSEHLDASFKREIWAHLGEVNKLMSSPAPSSIIGTQTIALQHFTSILPDLSDVFSKLELVSIATGFANAVTPGKGKIVIWKLVMYLQLVRGFLFDSPQSRSLLLEAVISWIKPHFGRYDEYAHTQQNNVEAVRDAARVSWLESIRLSITIIAVMLDKLQQALVNPAITGERKLYRQEQDNVEYTLSLLPRVLESYRELQSPASAQVLERHRSPSTTPTSVPVVFPSSYPFSLIANNSARVTPAGGAVSEQQPFFNCALGETAIVLLVLILSSPRKHLMNFLESTLDIEGKDNLSRQLNLFLGVATSILENDAWPKTWLNVNILAHKVILKMAQPMATVLIRDFIPEQQHSSQFDATLWQNTFYVLLKLLSSEQLVIEEFSPQKRRAVWKLAGDIRGEGAACLLQLWEALGWPEAISAQAGAVTRYGGYQVALISLVEHILNLCLSHHDQLRTNAVQILYSMIVSEYHLSGHFNEIETELVNKLDKLFMSDTKGDDISRAFFITQLRSLFDSSSVEEQLRVRVSDFLDSVDLFLELLLSVRELPEGDEYQDDRVIATLRLMNFIRRIGRDEIYIKYVHQLVNMHLQSQNYVEAALTLKLHSDLHEWDLISFVEPMPDLDLPRQSQFARKETLCLLILDYLGKGKAWESGVEICQELAFQHAEVTFNYQRLSEILVHQATLLDHIVNDQRYYSDYFRVAFYGNFPAALRDKQFIYRGFEWEKFGAFCERMLNKHPGAQLLKTMVDPPDEIRYGVEQYIQCTAVSPEPDHSRPIFTNPDVPLPVRTYYEHCAINTFSCSRPYQKSNQPYQSEFRDVWVEKTYFTTEESFPTVLRRSEVVDVSVVEISPIENALLDVEQKCKELTNLEVKYSVLAKTGNPVPTNALSMSLNGAVDAPVNGGISMYRQAFLSSEFVAQHPEQASLVQKLRDTIDEQVRIIDRCLKLHGQLCPPEMVPFHETLEKFFRKNFHDEIQKLPLENLSDQMSPSSSIRHAHLAMSPPSIYDSQSMNAVDLRKRSESITGRSSLAIGNIGGIPLRKSTSLYNVVTTPSHQRNQPSSSDGASSPAPLASIKRLGTQTPLQRNLAHLAKYGMTGVSSAPGDRAMMMGMGFADAAVDSPNGSFINVGPAPPSAAVPSSHRRENGSVSILSNTGTTRGRFSRLGSILRKEREA